MLNLTCFIFLENEGDNCDFFSLSNNSIATVFLNIREYGSTLYVGIWMARDGTGKKWPPIHFNFLFYF